MLSLQGTDPLDSRQAYRLRRAREALGSLHRKAALALHFLGEGDTGSVWHYVQDMPGIAAHARESLVELRAVDEDRQLRENSRNHEERTG